MKGYSEEYTVRGSDTDLFGNLRSARLMSLFQDIADTHTALHGVSNRDMHGRGAGWVIARQKISLLKPILCGERLFISTFQRPLRGIQFVRDTEVRGAEGELLAIGIGAWVLIDSESHEFLLPDRAKELVSGHETIYGSDKTERIQPLKMPKNTEQAGEKTFMFSDLDMNGHVNNARYLEAVCDACNLESEQGKYVSEFQISYKKECLSGEKITLLRSREGEKIYVEGRADGELRFEAGLSLSGI